MATLLSPTLFVASVQAEPQGQLIIAVDRDGGQLALQDAQFIFGGRNYCWYDSGWQGPGFYWCGYANRRGLGWGGGAGWHGWRGGVEVVKLAPSVAATEAPSALAARASRPPEPRVAARAGHMGAPLAPPAAPAEAVMPAGMVVVATTNPASQ